MNAHRIGRLALLAFVVSLLSVPAIAQEESLSPGANQNYQEKEVDVFIKSFENDRREVSKMRAEIVEATAVRPGETLADVGAGTGLFTRLFANQVGEDGKVLAVDIIEKFVKHVETTCKEEGLMNVRGVVSTERSCELEPASVDVLFCCNTYHHFEYPFAMLDSMLTALKPGGRMVLIDYRVKRDDDGNVIKGHCRAGKIEVIEECTKAGFVLEKDDQGLMKGQWLIELRKPAKCKG